MADEEQLRMIASVRDQASPVLRKMRAELRALGETRAVEGIRKSFDRFNESLDHARERFRDIRRENVRGLFEGIGLGAISAGGAVAGLSELLKSFAERKESLADMAKQINFNVQALDSLRGAGARMGIGASQMDAGLQTWNKNLADMRMHRGKLFQLLQQRNLPLEQRLEHSKSSEEAFKTYLGYLSTLKNQSAKDRMAQYGFGDQTFSRLGDLPELKEALEREHRFHLPVSSEDVKRAQAFEAAMSDIKASMIGLGDTISRQVLPVFTPMMEDFANFVRDNRDGIAAWFRKVAEALRGVDWRSVGQQIMDAFTKIGDAFGKINDMVEKIPGGWSTVIGGLLALKAANATGITGAIGTIGGGIAGGVAGAAAGGAGAGAAGGALRLLGPIAIPAVVAAMLKQFDPKGNLWGLTDGVDSWTQRHLGFNPSNITIPKGATVAPGLSTTTQRSNIDPGVMERARRAQQEWLSDPEAARGRAMMGHPSQQSNLPQQLAARTKLRLMLSQQNETLKHLRETGADKAYPGTYKRAQESYKRTSASLYIIEYTIRALKDGAKAAGRVFGDEAAKILKDIAKDQAGLNPAAFGGFGFPSAGGIIQAAFSPRGGGIRGFGRRSGGGAGGGFPSSYAPGAVPKNMVEGAQRAFSLLKAQGFSDMAAAALAGNFQQESSFNPNSLNAREGAHGIMQWRLARWTALQRYAASIGKSPNDFEAQIGFVKHELSSPAYKRFGDRLRSAKSLAEANHILHGYIGYGDNSEGTRGGNAATILKRFRDKPAPVTHRVHGDATVHVKFDGLPDGSRVGARSRGGLFSKVNVDRGASMVTA